MKKTLLVDLSYLDDLNRGYGQIALCYANYFKDNYNNDTSNYDLTLLVPKQFIGCFGDKVKYISSSNWFRKHSRYVMPQFDIWHNLQYPSRFRPYAKRTKYIFTIHDLNTLYLEYEGTQEDVDKNFRRISRHINQSSVITTISEFSKQQLKKYFNLNGKKLYMIYNGVESIANNPSSKPDIKIDKPFFFTLSVFRFKKNFHILLDLMKLMPDTHLYISGENDTEYGEMIKQRIKEEKINNVTLTGTITEEEKVWFYDNCEAFLFPSLFEGFGLPVIEAMQFGKPVFSSQKTSLKEIGGDFAYFWDNFEANEMKDIIENNLKVFYSDKDLIVRQIEYANSFSYKKHFDEYEKLYSEI